MGRRTKLTPETHERIIQAVRAGLTHERAAAAAGIDERTFYNWMKRGESSTRGIFFQFFQDIKKAEAEGELALVARIQRAASEGTWQAAAWLLERSPRTRPQWGRNVGADQERQVTFRVRFADSLDSDSEDDDGD